MNPLQKYDELELLWATRKIDELYQTVFQNLLLFQMGKVARPLAHCSSPEAESYFLKRQQMIDSGLIDEDFLRGRVINLVTRRA